MPGISRPSPIAPVDDASTVAIASTLANKRAASVINLGAGVSGGVRTVTASTYISSTDTQIEADTTAAGFTLRLPRISEYSRNRWKVRLSAGANVLTIAPRGSDTINSSATIAVTKQVEIYAVTNSNWRAIVVEV